VSAPAQPERPGGYSVTTDPDRLDLDLVHEYLSRQSYWAAGIPREVIERAVGNSIPFAVCCGSSQIGFARVVTDRATFAWLADVFILPEHRGLGLARWLLETVLHHPDLQGLRYLLLATADAHGLYQRVGFQPLREPGRFLVIQKSASELYRSDTGDVDRARS
jgi:GNAT superfamily N-acetyltransferase